MLLRKLLKNTPAMILLGLPRAEQDDHKYKFPTGSSVQVTLSWLYQVFLATVIQQGQQRPKMMAPPKL
jgi:hypothetical protein